MAAPEIAAAGQAPHTAGEPAGVTAREWAAGAAGAAAGAGARAGVEDAVLGGAAMVMVGVAKGEAVSGR